MNNQAEEEGEQLFGIVKMIHSGRKRWQRNAVSMEKGYKFRERKPCKGKNFLSHDLSHVPIKASSRKPSSLVAPWLIWHASEVRLIHAFQVWRWGKTKTLSGNERVTTWKAGGGGKAFQGWSWLWKWFPLPCEAKSANSIHQLFKSWQALQSLIFSGTSTLFLALYFRQPTKFDSSERGFQELSFRDKKRPLFYSLNTISGLLISALEQRLSSWSPPPRHPPPQKVGAGIWTYHKKREGQL